MNDRLMNYIMCQATHFVVSIARADINNPDRSKRERKKASICEFSRASLSTAMPSCLSLMHTKPVESAAIWLALLARSFVLLDESSPCDVGWTVSVSSLRVIVNEVCVGFGKLLEYKYSVSLVLECSYISMIRVLHLKHIA